MKGICMAISWLFAFSLMTESTLQRGSIAFLAFGRHLRGLFVQGRPIRGTCSTGPAASAAAQVGALICKRSVALPVDLVGE